MQPEVLAAVIKMVKSRLRIEDISPSSRTTSYLAHEDAGHSSRDFYSDTEVGSSDSFLTPHDELDEAGQIEADGMRQAGAIMAEAERKAGELMEETRRLAASAKADEARAAQWPNDKQSSPHASDG